MILPYLVIAIALFNRCGNAAPAEDVGAEEQPVSYSGYQLWSAIPKTDEEREFLLKLQDDYGFELWKAIRSNDSPMDLLVPPDFQTEVKMRLDDMKIPFNVSIDDLQKAINEENPPISTIDEELDNRFTSRVKRYMAAYISFFHGHKMDWNSYHRLDDIYGYLNYLADTYPDLVQLTSIGSSSEGRPLYVLRISSEGKSSKPAIWIDGGIHAREWISPAAVTYIIHELVEVQSNRQLLRDVDWYIMPVMNPDGYEFTQTGMNRLWRKTRSTKGVRCRGADPNRNFGYKWGGKGTSKDPCSEIYHGPSAFSEPETRAVSSFIQGKANRLKLYLTVHSYGQYILIPWGYDVAVPSDYPEMKALADKAASKFRRYRYTVGNSADLLYPAAGGSDDWAKSIGIKYSYTVELPDTGGSGFVLPASQIKPVCEDFFLAMEVFANQVASS